MPATKDTIVTKLSNVNGITKTKAHELYQAGARIKSDLRKPQFYKLLPKEAKFNIRYNVSSCISHTHVKKIQALFPRYLTLVGSGRRCSLFSHDIDFITSRELAGVITDIKSTSGIKFIGQITHGSLRSSIIVQIPAINIIVKVDIFKADRNIWAFALLHHTGSKEFNIRTRAHALSLGYKLSQYGLFTKDGKQISGLKTEKSILQKINITYLTPRNR